MASVMGRGAVYTNRACCVVGVREKCTAAWGGVFPPTLNPVDVVLNYCSQSV